MLPSVAAPPSLPSGRCRRLFCALLGGVVIVIVIGIGGCGVKSSGLPAVPRTRDAGPGGQISIRTDASAEDDGRAGDGVVGDAAGGRSEGGDATPARDGMAGQVGVPEVRPPDPTPADAAPAARALLLVGAQPAGAADALLRQHMEGLGFIVEVLPMRTAREAAAATTAAAGQRVIVLSSSLPDSPGLAMMLRDLAVPVVCLTPVFLEDIAIGDSPFGEEIGNSMAIVRPDHPLAAGRSGRVRVTTISIRLIFGHPLPGATVIATGPDDNILVTVFALERGAPAASGPARARRVAWVAQEATISALNADGWALLEAAFSWAAASP
jgi:hypothetical protein